MEGPENVFDFPLDFEKKRYTVKEPHQWRKDMSFVDIKRRREVNSDWKEKSETNI